MPGIASAGGSIGDEDPGGSGVGRVFEFDGIGFGKIFFSSVRADDFQRILREEILRRSGEEDEGDDKWGAFHSFMEQNNMRRGIIDSYLLIGMDF